MKVMIMVMAVAMSLSANAALLTSGGIGGTIATSVTDANSSAQKDLLVKDAAEFYHSGKISLALAQEIKDIQAEFDVSDMEAVDMIVEYAEIVSASK